MSEDVSDPQADFFGGFARDDVVVDNGMSAVGTGSGFVARVRGRITGGSRGRGAPAGEGRVWFWSGLRGLGGREASTARVGLAGGSAREAWRGIAGRLRPTREWGERLRRGHGSTTRRRSGVMVTVAATYRDIATSDFAGKGRVWLRSGLRSLGGWEAPTARVGLAGGAAREAWRGIAGRLRPTREWGERLRRGHGSTTRRRSGVMVTVATTYRDIATSDFWDSCSSSNTEEYEREEG
ncbi:hypothetical protein V8E55_005951 [Tylopilus felleus]